MRAKSSEGIKGFGGFDDPTRILEDGAGHDARWRYSIGRPARAELGDCRRNPARAMRRVQLRGGARWQATRGVLSMGECGAMSGPRRRKFVGPIVSRVTWHGGRGRRTSADGPFSSL